ncbi:MAG: hypothetical protein QOF92_4916 [Pseudonocardiales bacterium]|jgi:AcrR family transcriptional regulator|nr:hypothetical protein [Pseudonocardiales bacterium]
MGPSFHEGHSSTMTAVSTAYEKTGRQMQKRRTREALVSAARELVAEGEAPTVERAAAAAGISRTTAYRYFTNQHSLLAAAHPETTLLSLLPGELPEDAEGRLNQVAATFIDQIAKTEPQQRTMLRLSLSDPAQRGELPLRQGRAIGWFTEALTPLEDELSPAEIHQLVLAIRSAIGIEARVWLTDIGGLSSSEIAALQGWIARSLLRAAQVESPPSPRRKPRRGVGGG